MMIVLKKSELRQKVDDTAHAGRRRQHKGNPSLSLCRTKAEHLFYGTYGHYVGLFYGFQSGRVGAGFRQIGVQLLGILFVVIINIVSTTLICLLVQLVVPLRMSEEDMEMGDEAAHGEEAYAIWDQGDKLGDGSRV